MSKLSLGVRDGESLQIGDARITFWLKQGKGKRGRLVISAPPSLRIGRLEGAVKSHDETHPAVSAAEASTSTRASTAPAPSAAAGAVEMTVDAED